MEPPVQDRVGRGRHAADRDDRAEAEALERRQVEAPDALGQMGEGVRALVAGVLARVGQRADAAGVEDDDGRSCDGATIARWARSTRATP